MAHKVILILFLVVYPCTIGAKSQSRCAVNTVNLVNAFHWCLAGVAFVALHGDLDIFLALCRDLSGCNAVFLYQKLLDHTVYRLSHHIKMVQQIVSLRSGGHQAVPIAFQIAKSENLVQHIVLELSFQGDHCMIDLQ